MSSEDAKVPLPSSDVVEDSETTVEIKIKTLDAQTYTLRVDKCMPVPALKEQIAIVTGVLSAHQRLICRGKVLKDDQLLSAYHVEDGHTLHLVVRQPRDSSIPSTSSEGTSSHPATSGSESTRDRGASHIRSFVFETVNVGQGDINTSVLGQIISRILGHIETPNTGTENTTNEHREIRAESFEGLQQMGAETRSRNNDGGLTGSFQPQPNLTTVGTQFDRQHANYRFPSTVPLRPLTPTVIPDSLTTLNEYIGLLRDEFRREGFAANGREHNNNTEAFGIQHTAQGGLPSPASLAEILLSTRQFLLEQTSECLSQLARQLEDHARVTDPLMRMEMQSSAMRYGALMQNLGAMLLELGRATMTLRMGQTPSEAIVNAGPANYISASGPNPLMVQFVPGSTIGGMHTGTVNSGHGGQPDPPLPRNVEIRIRTVNRAVPAAASNAGDHAGTQNPQQQEDLTRSYAANVVRQAISGISGGDSGFRVVPIRTVVAVPSGVAASPTDSSGGSVQLSYPLFTGTGQRSTGNANNARGSQASSQPHQGGPEFDQQPTHDCSVQRENLESSSGGTVRDGSRPANTTPYVSELRPLGNESSGWSSRFFIPRQQRQPNSDTGSSSQANDGMNRNVESHEAAGASSEQGVFLANVLHQLMPLISQGRQSGVSPTNPSSSHEQIDRENLNGSSSSQHPHDPPENPSPKRRKSE
ncbi:uncharacterized protein M6B38_121145 [Iris pallida]|uniref:Ubiquitin-like domain-containing protein n=1 Tax=Iris pallida TaxID=29817 RepID=A0AAX6H7W8_IRIPA|nr:uncharacterized protein M6B38_121145 [Iris pallida]